MKLIVIAFFVMRISYFNSQINHDSIMETNIYLPKVTRFSSKFECQEKEIKYSNGQDFFKYSFNSDSILSEYTYYFKNGNIAFYSKVISYEKEILNATDFDLTISEIQYSYYNSGELRHICLNSPEFHYCTIYGKKSNILYDEYSLFNKKVKGIFVDSFEKNIPGIIYKFYHKGSLKYTIITDYNYNVLKITDLNERRIKNKNRLKYFEKIIQFKIGILNEI